MTNAKKPAAAMVEAGVCELMSWPEGDGKDGPEAVAAIYAAMRNLEPAAPVEDGEVVEAVARAMEPRVWEAFDGYIATGFCPKDYTREQQYEAFIYGSPLDRGHDWGCDLERSLKHAKAAVESLKSQPPAADALVDGTIEERATYLLEWDRKGGWATNADVREAIRTVSRAALAKLQGGGK